MNMSHQLEPLDLLASWPSICSITIALGFAVHKLLVHLDYPILSVFELLWNTFVYFMPAPVVYALKTRSIKPIVRRDSIGGTGATEHAAKSEILRDVFGLDRVVQAAEKAVVRGPRGLGNWDNSCFQNSVLQALSSLKDFREFLERFQGVENEDVKDSTLAALRSLVLDLNDRSESCNHLWTPAKLKSMDSWQQQDAQEYYSKVLDYLEKDVKVMMQDQLEPDDPGLCSFSSLAQSNAIRMDHSARMVKATKGSSVPACHASSQRGSIAQSPLDGLLAQRVGCLQCGFTEGLSLIPFNCITLPLGKQPAYDVRECLDSFTELELIEQVECGKCTLLRAQSQLQQLIASTSPQKVADNAPTESPYTSRLNSISSALSTSDFSDTTLKTTCQIPAKVRISSTKSRQAVIMRSPPCLVLHINRSLFDEYTGSLLKNHAHVEFPMTLDLAHWVIGSKNEALADTTSPTDDVDVEIEKWEMDPTKTLKPDSVRSSYGANPYSLAAVITHYGRHENGHYICYRKVPGAPQDDEAEGDKQQQWWRLSDEQVSQVSEEEVLAQGGAFMLFYERSSSSNVDAQEEPRTAES